MAQKQSVIVGGKTFAFAMEHDNLSIFTIEGDIMRRVGEGKVTLSQGILGVDRLEIEPRYRSQGLLRRTLGFLVERKRPKEIRFSRVAKGRKPRTVRWLVQGNKLKNAPRRRL